MEAVTDIDVTGAENLASLTAWLDSQHIQLGYSRIRPETAARLDHLELLPMRRPTAQTAMPSARWPVPELPPMTAESSQTAGVVAHLLAGKIRAMPGVGP
jgi:hypothetical protein